jgi:hypothetical protein
MHTRAAVAVFDAEASNKIMTGKVTTDRSMSHPFHTAAYWYAGFVSVNAGSIVPERAITPRMPMNVLRKSRKTPSHF